MRRGIPLEGLQRGLWGDLVTDGLAHRGIDRQPPPLAVEVDHPGGRLDLTGAERIGDAEVEVADEGGDRRLVAIGLVGLEHRELGRVSGVDAFVAEDPAELVDPVDPTDDGLLEVELERDPQGHALVKGVEVRVKRPGRRAAVDELQDRRLDLDVTLGVQGLAQRSCRGGSEAHHVAGLLAHDEVGVPLPHSGLLGEVLVQRGQRAQSLGGHLPRARHDRQLAALARDDPPIDSDVVAEVDERLPVGQGSLADLGLTEHDLQAGADALLEGGEAELAGVADIPDPPGRHDPRLGLLSRGQVPPLVADVRERVRAPDPDRVCRVPARDEPLPLLAPDPELLGQVVGRHVCGLACRHSCRRVGRRVNGAGSHPPRVPSG